jgi:integrase
MARPICKLSALAVEKAKSPGRLSDGGGLYLSIAPAGTKSWVFMWTKRGRRREMGLGPFPAIGLKRAREKASLCRTQVAEGLDPIAERNRLHEKSFGDCADAYITSMEVNWRNEKHKYQWRQTLTGYCGSIRDRPVSTIHTEDVLRILKPIWNEKHETAKRLRGRIEAVLDYASSKEWRAGENPARWRGHLKNLLPAHKRASNAHLPALEYAEVPTLIGQLVNHDALAAKALIFTILTAARTGEVLKATWSEFDLEREVWTIPPQRMKGAEEHVVPLSDAALGVVKALHENRVSEYVFPGQKVKKPLSNMSMHMLLRRVGIKDACVHGFRSSFRDWAGDETSFPREVAEAALSHKVGNAVERAYRRGTAVEKRRHLMQAWADYCCLSAQDNVVSINEMTVS